MPLIIFAVNIVVFVIDFIYTDNFAVFISYVIFAVLNITCFIAVICIFKKEFEITIAAFENLEIIPLLLKEIQKKCPSRYCYN